MSADGWYDCSLSWISRHNLRNNKIKPEIRFKDRESIVDRKIVFFPKTLETGWIHPPQAPDRQETPARAQVEEPPPCPRENRATPFLKLRKLSPIPKQDAIKVPIFSPQTNPLIFQLVCHFQFLFL